jgi:tRNA A-37 threonylcarbamoyl transferase component Bud32/tetratricopeptide (TPR) repeat protein
VGVGRGEQDATLPVAAPLSAPLAAPLAATLAAAADATLAVTPAPASDARPATIGRHLVIERLGAGAMGVVYAAYDPELDRKLAIKVIAPQPRPGEDLATARLRVLREAQAMARITHPGVVQIFDVGTHDGQIFLAMELVDGETLGAWLARARRPWREVLELFVQAGRGLAAAHAVGLVHRDFKPDNVLVDRRGRARVADFGLARAADLEAAAPLALAAAPGRASAALSSQLTYAEGGLVGTPAYMAPELLHGGPADARSDLYAFSVALFEALHGRRPFAGATLVALFDAVLTGAIDEPRGARLPAWLRRAVLRGLARDPAQRHASMDELLAALTDVPARRRRLATGAAGLVTAGLLGLSLTTFSEAHVCKDIEAPLAAVWGPARNAALAARFADPARPYAATAWASVARRFDDYGAAWVTMRRDACEATQVRGEASTELMDRRMACLDQRLLALRRLVEVIEESNPSIIDAAPSFIGALRPLDRCADAGALLADIPPPEDPAVAQEVAHERDRLARVDAFVRVGRITDAAELAAGVVAVARALPYPPLLAEALLAHGHARRLAWGEDAADLLTEAYTVAEAADHARARLGAALDLAALLGARHLDAAEVWIQIAEAIARHIDEPELTGDLARVRGILAFHRNDFATAEAHFWRAADAYRSLGPDHEPDVAAVLSNIGAVRIQSERADEAEVVLRDSIALVEASFGPDNPLLANTFQNLGSVLGEQGRARESAELLATRELPLRVAAYGPTHAVVRDRLCGLGMAWLRAGDGPAALDAYARCLAIAPSQPAPHADLRAHLARCGLLRGDEAARRASCDRARDLVDEAAAGDRWRDSVEVEAAVSTLALAGVPADAPVVEPLLARAVEAGRDRGSTYLLAVTHLAVARRDLDLGRHADADAALTRARESIAGLRRPGTRATLTADADRIAADIAARRSTSPR